MTTAGTLQLPPLREELTLHESGRNDAGEPTWVVHDPVTNRYFRLGWLEFEVLCRWSLGSPQAIAGAISRDSLLEVDAEEVETVLQFLSTHNLLQARGEQAIGRMLEQHEAARKGSLTWWLKNYLFVRIPLLRPDAFLERTLPWVSWLWSPTTLWVLLGLALLGIYLVIQQWESFLSTLPHLFSLQGMLTVAGAIVFTKILHELGHGYTAKRFGCKVPTMGVAFLVLWPVLYTDSSDAWRLGSRRQRLAIASAGIVVELVLAVIATLVWSFMPDGPVRSAVFLVATTTWVLTLLVNLNPFMRFDGYYLFSDYLGVANLQDRAFKLGKWRLREWLFGFGEPRPERLPRERLLIAYAYGTWIYRFFLFLAIALLVYYFFFKALGIFLMVVELAWFIGRPVWNEVKEWRERQHLLRWNRRTVRTTLIVSFLLGLLVFPWQGSVTAPGVWRAMEHGRVFTPLAGQVSAIHAELDDLVAAGDLLLELESPDLAFEIEQGARRLRMLRWQLEFANVDASLRERARVVREELASEQAAQSDRLREQERMQVRAPVNGVVAELLDPLVIGDWIEEDRWLATVVATGQGRLEAYVQEADLEAFAAGAEARFYPADLSRAPFAVTVVLLEPFSTRVLMEPHLASLNDGPIAVRENADGEHVPEQTIYRVLLEPAEALAGPRQVVTGHVKIEAERRTVLGRVVRRVVAVLVRESSF